ncbi:hypothetical protein [Kribbella sp. NPDC055071]
MTTKLPTDRPLPHKQEILERVLAEAVQGDHRRRGWLVPVGAAASIALVAGGVLVATAGHDQTRQAPTAGPASKNPSKAPATVPRKPPLTRPLPSEIDIDLGPLTAAEEAAAAQNCLSQSGDANQATQIGHATRVMSWVPGKVDSTVAFTTAPEGLRVGCAGPPTAMEAAVVGGDRAAAKRYKIALNQPDATHPAAPTEGNGSYQFIDFDKKPDLVVKDAWYRVDERVASIRQRWVMRGKPGPWYVANALDGLVFLRSWDESTALKLGETVRVETQVLDKDGKLLDAPGDQKGGGGLTPSPGTTRVDEGKVIANPEGMIDFR